jgi:hypothetical protein
MHLSSILSATSSSSPPNCQPPYANPFEGSSSGPPGACITPSRVMNVVVMIFLMETILPHCDESWKHYEIQKMYFCPHTEHVQAHHPDENTPLFLSGYVHLVINVFIEGFFLYINTLKCNLLSCYYALYTLFRVHFRSLKSEEERSLFELFSLPQEFPVTEKATPETKGLDVRTLWGSTLTLTCFWRDGEEKSEKCYGGEHHSKIPIVER